MQKEIKDKFIVLWRRYFGNAELPIVFYYTYEEHEEIIKPKGRICLICELAKVRNGKTAVYNKENIICPGGKRYLNFEDKMPQRFEYFLSCGDENREGERYKRTPDIVREILKNQQVIDMKRSNIVFKRWDKLEENDNPEVVIFFVKADVLSGLFGLANFDQIEANGTIVPFGSGCASIVYHPYMESKSKNPKAVIGIFDIYARSCLSADYLTFAVPMKKFEMMVSYMEESFLITSTWTKIKKRINRP